MLKERAKKLTGNAHVDSPIRAGKLKSPATNAERVNSNVKHFIKRSISMPSIANSTSSALKEALGTKQRNSSNNLLVQLTDEQKRVLDAIRQGKNVFFTGSGGSGKSFLLRIIKQYLPHDSCFVTASTGVAASLIGGITLHAFAGISGNDSEQPAKEEGEEENEASSSKLISRIFQCKDKLQNWKRCKHLIIDEISMVDAHMFEMLDQIAR